MRPIFNDMSRFQVILKPPQVGATTTQILKALYMAKKNWIAEATKNKGALHENLGVPEGKKIPEKKLESAAKKPGKEGKRARLAETLKKMKK